MVVCDRENHRLEYFDIMGNNQSLGRHEPTFIYQGTTSFPELKRPCNFRLHASGVAIVPTLEGMVGILDASNNLLSLINISDTLGDEGFLHPHDAHFLPSSYDFVLVTWNPGRVGFFRRMKNEF